MFTLLTGNQFGLQEIVTNSLSLFVANLQPPAPSPPVPSGGPQNAAYSEYIGAPWCKDSGSECSSGTLLNGRGTGSVSNGGELNQPNTIDGCVDGSGGSNEDSDESLEKIVVRSDDGAGIREGGVVTIIATVWADADNNDFQYDYADFYHASDFGLYTKWELIGTVQAAQGKEHELMMTHTLPPGGSSYQAVRVQFRARGSSSSACDKSYDGGKWNDRDDLVFKVQRSTQVSL
jgi:leucyl aminopeptidase